jgi:hypothetical protein
VACFFYYYIKTVQRLMFNVVATTVINLASVSTFVIIKNTTVKLGNNIKPF